jgi:hypothetical protein
MKPWPQFELWCAALSFVGGVLWVWRLNRDVRRANLEQNADRDAVRKLRSEEWCAWILTTIGLVYLLMCLVHH